MAESKRTGTKSRQGSRQRTGTARKSRSRAKAAEEAVEPTTWSPDDEPRGAAVGQFAHIVGGFEYEQGEEKLALDGLYGTVDSYAEVDKTGRPVTCIFSIITRAIPGVVRPETGNGKIAVPYDNLRRAPAGLA